MSLAELAPDAPPKIERWDPRSGSLPSPEQRPASWNPTWVGLRMIEAYAVLRKLPEKGGGGAAWPAYVHTWEDVIHWGDWRDRVWQDWQRTKGAHAWQVSRMDQAMAWPGHFLRGQPGAARCLTVWAMCRGWRIPLRPELLKRGWSQPTLSRKKGAACTIIAEGLNRQSVVVT